MTNQRIYITVPSGERVRTAHSRRYFIVCDPPFGKPFVVMRTDNLAVARRTVKGWTYRHLYDSTTETFL